MQGKQWLGVGLLLGILGGASATAKAQVGYQPLGPSPNPNAGLPVVSPAPHFVFNGFTPIVVPNSRRGAQNPAHPNQGLHQALPQAQFPPAADTPVVPAYMTHRQYFHPVNLRPQPLPRSQPGERR